MLNRAGLKNWISPPSILVSQQYFLEEIMNVIGHQYLDLNNIHIGHKMIGSLF